MERDRTDLSRSWGITSQGQGQDLCTVIQLHVLHSVVKSEHALSLTQASSCLLLLRLNLSKDVHYSLLCSEKQTREVTRPRPPPHSLCCSFTIARGSQDMAIICLGPCHHFCAMSSGVSPASLRKSREAPWATSTSAACFLPWIWAQCRGVHPSFLRCTLALHRASRRRRRRPT